MKYPVRNEKRFTVLSLNGEIDLQCSPLVRREVLQYVVEDNRHVLIDMADVEYIDSSGIATLVEAYQAARKRHLDFGLLRVSQPAMLVLELARLDQVFPIYATLDAIG